MSSLMRGCQARSESRHCVLSSWSHVALFLHSRRKKRPACSKPAWPRGCQPPQWHFSNEAPGNDSDRDTSDGKTLVWHQSTAGISACRVQSRNSLEGIFYLREARRLKVTRGWALGSWDALYMAWFFFPPFNGTPMFTDSAMLASLGSGHKRHISMFIFFNTQ